MSQYFKSFKTKINSTKLQCILFAKAAGTARHAYNWGLAEVLKALENNESVPSAMTLHKKLVAEVKKENPWYYEVSKCAPGNALRNLENAYKRWFKKLSGKPKFKHKNRKDSFHLNGAIHIKDNKIKLPRIGWVNCFEQLPAVKPKTVTVSKQAGDWYVSFYYEFTPERHNHTNVIGVDLGIKTLATCSDGTIWENPKAYRKHLIKLKRLQRLVSRKQKHSQNRGKAIVKLQRQHRKVANIRKDNLHKLTTWLAKNHGVIGIETLNTLGMLRNHKLAMSIADAAFGTFRSFLSYKCEWYGAKLILADTFYPSSKLCSNCGAKKETLSLSERTYNCEHCNSSIDRDLNAAINLAALATASSAGSNACGDGALASSVKQELSKIC